MKSIKSIILIILSLSYSSQLKATVLRYLPLEELIKNSYSIVIGTVKEVTSTFDNNLSKIVTKVQVEVEQNYGNHTVERTVEVVTLGGSIGTQKLIVSGEAKFSTAEKVLVFLEKKDRGYFVTMGMAQGKFTITKEGDEEVVIRDLSGIPLLSPSTPLTNNITYKGTEKFPLKTIIQKIKKIFRSKR